MMDKIKDWWLKSCQKIKDTDLIAVFGGRLMFAFFLMKYGFALALTIYAAARKGFLYFFMPMLELMMIFCVSNRILRMKYLRAGQVINGLFMFIYNVQMVVLAFGSTYVTLVMLTNVSSLEDLSGRAVLYTTGAIMTLVFSFLPVAAVPFPNVRVLCGVLALELMVSMISGAAYSPLFDYYKIRTEAKENKEKAKRIADANVDESEFLKEHVSDYYNKGDVRGKNVVLILTEGLSQEIIEDSRNIMPNVAEYEKKSLNFTNYYNHTFATYRGIIGQLYSGYQLENLDENYLVSMEELFKENGYYTSFLNAEPNNTQFTTYLNTLGFDDVIGEPGNDYEGNTNSISDKEIYAALFDQMEEQAKNDKPFFTVVYTFGTHLSFDSTDQKFGDGSNPLLDKFYDADYQFGQFMEKFETSDLAENTVIAFTADHAAYIESSFQKTFPDLCSRPGDLSRVPFFLYYSGITRKEVDVEGRNSIDLAPTICDYLDIDGENYFLGESLFAPTQNNNSFDTFFSNSSAEYSTAGGEIKPLSEAEQNIFDSSVEDYYALAAR